MGKTPASPPNSALPTLSVVIPAYNEQDVIGHCLEALKAQSGDITEVIVVDNGSSDATADIVRQMASDWPQLTLIHERHKGVVSARNSGFDQAKGDIIGRIDADTLVSEGWARSYRSFFARDEAGTFGASTGMAVPYDLPMVWLAELVYRVFILQSNRLITKNDTLFGTNMAIRTKAWHAIRGEVCQKSDLMEDMDLGLHLRRHGYRVKAADAHVRFSARRLLTNPLNYFEYARMWPMTYWHHGMRLTAILTWPFMIGGCVLQTAFWPIIRAYDPSRRRFSLRRLLSRQVTREIPKGA